jgi:gliding motility-associated protein GldE
LETDLDPLPDLLNFLLTDFYKGFSLEAGISLAVMILLLIASGLVSGSETAFFSLSPADLDALRNRNDKKSKLILHLREIPKKLLATILIANNFINVMIVMVSTYITALLFDLEKNALLAFIIQVVVVTSVILLFGEIIPKILANQKPLKIASITAPTLRFLVTFFSPLSSILVKSTSFIDKKLSRKDSTISMSELSEAIDITVNDESDEEEKAILKGIATFGEKEASEIMRSRVDVVAIDFDTPFDEVLKIVVDSGFSRIPVYKETFDQIEGLLYIKDLLPYLHKSKDFKWQKLIRPAFFVPENKKINELLQDFRTKKIHLAIVVDEYGGTSGIITLEDIIEEIVGEIIDEYDIDEQPFEYEKISDNEYIFEAKTPLIDFCKILEIDNDIFDEVKGDSDSLGGLILELEGKIPDKGEKITYKNFEFEIADADERKINKIKITIKDTPADEQK